MMLRHVRALCFLVLALPALAGGADLPAYEWPDAPPEVLREEIFGIRFELILGDKGLAKAVEFLRKEAAKRPDAPEVQAYLVRVSLYSETGKMEELVPRAARETQLRAAMAGGSLLAKDLLGYALVDGRLGIARNPEEGLRLLREAAAAGFPRSIGRLARMQVEGFHVPLRPAEGALGLRRARALGSTADLGDLARAYEKKKGRGIPLADQPAAALEYYYQMTENNDALGWSKLKELVEQQVPGAKLTQAIAYVRSANEGGGMVAAALKPHLALLEAEGREDPRACVELGVAKLEASAIRRDHAGAKRLFTFASGRGNKEARFFLAYMKLRGLAGPQEKETAIAEMKALAEAGDARAAGRLGYYYYFGSREAGSLPKDPALAFRYTRQAAELGSRWAAFNLAHCYNHGIGTPANPVLAAKMYWLAWGYGVRDAKEGLLRQLAFID